MQFFCFLFRYSLAKHVPFHGFCDQSHSNNDYDKYILPPKNIPTNKIHFMFMRGCSENCDGESQRYTERKKNIAHHVAGMEMRLIFHSYNSTFSTPCSLCPVQSQYLIVKKILSPLKLKLIIPDFFLANFLS